jgi:hypothetical protein
MLAKENGGGTPRRFHVRDDADDYQVSTVENKIP